MTAMVILHYYSHYCNDDQIKRYCNSTMWDNGDEELAISHFFEFLNENNHDNHIELWNAVLDHKQGVVKVIPWSIAHLFYEPYSSFNEIQLDDAEELLRQRSLPHSQDILNAFTLFSKITINADIPSSVWMLPDEVKSIGTLRKSKECCSIV